MANPAEALVFDATPLIYFAKTGAFGPLARLPHPFLVPPLVVREVVEAGRERWATETQSVDRLLRSGRIAVHRVENPALLERLREDPRISDGDREALALALEAQARLVADEDILRRRARLLGVPVGGSLLLLRRLKEGGILTEAETVELLDRMIALGWFCSPALYQAFLTSL